MTRATHTVEHGMSCYRFGCDNPEPGYRTCRKGREAQKQYMRLYRKRRPAREAGPTQKPINPLTGRRMT